MYYSEEFRKSMVSAFNKHGECKAAAMELGVSSDTIKHWVQKAGITTNDRVYSRSRKGPTISERWPLEIETLAYICGLIAADGNLFKGAIKIALQEQDKEVLEFVRRATINNFEDFPLVYSSRESRVNCSPTYSTGGKLDQLYSFCQGMGITPAKSLTMDLKLDDKSDEFLWYFLRGMLDGDGCIIMGSSLAESSIRLSSGSPQCIRTLQKIFGGTIAKSGPIENLQFKGALAKQLAENLPVDDFTMARKTSKIEAIRLQVSQAVRNSSVLVGAIWGISKKPTNMIDAWRQSAKLVSYETVKWRVYQGWTLEDAVSTPKHIKRLPNPLDK